MDLTYWYVDHMDNLSRPSISNDIITGNKSKEQDYHTSHRGWERYRPKPNETINTETS
jgi:hypothetical protein